MPDGTTGRDGATDVSRSGDGARARHTMTRRVVSERSPTLVARVTRCIPMTYAAGADLSADRPAHVRAASGLAWFGDRLAVVQDDANFIALVDPATGLTDAVPLPPGPGGIRPFDDSRGHKADKLDLEAIVCLPRATHRCSSRSARAPPTGASATRSWIRTALSPSSGSRASMPRCAQRPTSQGVSST